MPMLILDSFEKKIQIRLKNLLWKMHMQIEQELLH